MKNENETFPILVDPKGSGLVTGVPWDMLAERIDRVKKNHHGFSLEQLADAGGLTVLEVLGVIHDMDFITTSISFARSDVNRNDVLRRRVTSWLASRQPKDEIK